jgi:lipid-A-disaccharide synthase
MGERLLADPDGDVDLLLLAAECSGDELGAALIRDYRELNPRARIYAIGGENMAREADFFLHNLAEHAVMGLVEVLRHYGFFRKIFSEIVEWICRFRPRRVCFIDSPALNLRIARELTARGVSHRGGGDVFLYHYVAPQVWAWRPGRRFAMARDLDALAVLFPFEPAAFADTSLPTTFVGHPFAESGHRNCVFFEANRKILLLPGSRQAAVGRIFPTMLHTLSQLGDGCDLEGVCIYPTESVRGVLVELLRKNPAVAAKVSLLSADAARRSPVGARLALVGAGTMSLQCALEGIPGVVIYRSHPITHWLARRLVRVRFITIANLLLDYECYPELLQERAQPEAIAGELRRLLHGRPEFADVARELRQRLGNAESSPGRWLSLPPQLEKH